MTETSLLKIPTLMDDYQESQEQVLNNSPSKYSNKQEDQNFSLNFQSENDYQQN